MIKLTWQYFYDSCKEKDNCQTFKDKEVMWSLLQGNLFHNSDNMGLYCNEGYSVPTPLSTRIWWSLPCLWKLPRDQNALRPQGLVPWVNRLLSAYSDSIILRPCPPRLYGNDASPPDNFVSLRLQLHAQYDTSRSYSHVLARYSWYSHTVCEVLQWDN